MFVARNGRKFFHRSLRGVRCKSSGNTKLQAILDAFAKGQISVNAAIDQIGGYESVSNYAKVDHARAVRTGFPEVVYGEGKTVAQVKKILLAMIDRSLKGEFKGPVVASRISESMWNEGLSDIESLEYHADSHLVVYRGSTTDSAKTTATLGRVAVLSAGTSDQRVAEEAALLVELCGGQVERIYDVGVAGIHRLFANLSRVEAVDVAICVAGMDGAMPSVVAGLVRCPVIAVPTSVGYGAAFQGVTPLLTMLSACAPGIAVVNIDNGFGAAAMAVKILNVGARKAEEQSAEGVP